LKRNVLVTMMLGAHPEENALAFSVVPVPIDKGEVYTGADSVGSRPSVVYRIDAPADDDVIVTDCTVANRPPAGVMTGVAGRST
jgi:hypothetical protein